MKKLSHIICKLLFWFFCILSILSLFVDVSPTGSTKDECGYKISMSLFFGTFTIGFLLKLLGQKKDIQNTSKKTIFSKIIYWFMICLVSCLLMVTTQKLICSEEYLIEINKANNKKTTEEITTTPSKQTSTSTTTEIATELSTEAITELTTEEITNSNTEEENILSATIPNIDTNSIYYQLSDDEFKLLTELMAKSFYTFNLEDDDFEILENNAKVKECLQSLYDYAYENSFELDPKYKEVFSTKYDVVSNISNYDILQKNFIIEYFRDPVNNQWIYNINSYTINEADVVEYDGIKYIDAEGYLQPDVYVYWIEGDKMCEVGIIKDIAYNKEIDGCLYPYALNVDFFDDPYSSGWMSGYLFLRTNKELTGKPLYYIKLLDPNRTIYKEEIDYEGNITWYSLSTVPDNNLIGTEVYVGTTNTKSYIFKIHSANKANDILYVEYPNGNIEFKSYTSIINNNTLYVK